MGTPSTKTSPVTTRLMGWSPFSATSLAVGVLSVRTIIEGELQAVIDGMGGDLLVEVGRIDFVAVLSFAGQPMKRKERYIARLDEVTITREGDSAVIQYKEEGILTTHLNIGPKIAGMSDEAILELFNDTLRAQAQLAGEYKHVAVEVPLGSPQIKYFARGYQWCPRGGVLRCLVEDDENGQLVVGIDDQELNLEEFGRMLTTYAGWGMRIEFMPDDQLHRRPALEVREPDPENESTQG